MFETVLRIMKKIRFVAYVFIFRFEYIMFNITSMHVYEIIRNTLFVIANHKKI